MAGRKRTAAKGAKKPEKKVKPVASSDEEEENVVEETVEPTSEDEVEEKPSKGRKKEKEEDVDEEDANGVEEEEEEDDEPKAKRGKPASKTSKKKPAPKGKGKGKKKGPASKKASTTPAKKASKDESESEEDPDAEYEVERILEVQNLRGGKREFLVKWKGYPQSKATWEPEDNLECPELMDAFLKKLESKNLSGARRLSTFRDTIASKNYRIQAKRESIQEARVGVDLKLGSQREANTSTFRPFIKPKFDTFDINPAITRSSNSNESTQNKPNLKKVAAVSCGVVALSVGAAIFHYSDTVYWKNLQQFQPQVQQAFETIQTKVKEFYHAALHSS